MITELRVQNFKSWQDTNSLQFAPLTGFFGANNSGKTSILQLLLLLKQTAERPPEWNEPLYFGNEESLVNLVNFDNVIYQHEPTSDLSISVSWKLPRQVADIGGYSTNSLSFSTTITKNVEQPELELFYYTTTRGYTLAVQRAPTKRTGIFGEDIIEPSEYLTTFDDKVAAFRCYGIASDQDKDKDPFRDLQNNFENLFSQVHHVGPLRRDPQHRYNWGSSHPPNVGQYGEDMISALLSGRVRLLSVDNQILNWLQKLKLIDSYNLRPSSDSQDYEFRVKQHENGTEVGLTDIGFGVSQVLPVLILCYYADEGSILILEQPEAHLHPKAQSELADVLIDVVKKRKVQIILESHSEHLLHRLQRRIAEEEIAADDTALYFCQINDGSSKAERLDVDEYGNILNYPLDFFGDDLGDLVKKTEAEMKRREVTE